MSTRKQKYAAVIMGLNEAVKKMEALRFDHPQTPQEWSEGGALVLALHQVQTATSSLATARDAVTTESPGLPVIGGGGSMGNGKLPLETPDKKGATK